MKSFKEYAVTDEATSYIETAMFIKRIGEALSKLEDARLTAKKLRSNTSLLKKLDLIIEELEIEKNNAEEGDYDL